MQFSRTRSSQSYPALLLPTPLEARLRQPNEAGDWHAVADEIEVELLAERGVEWQSLWERIEYNRRVCIGATRISAMSAPGPRPGALCGTKHGRAVIRLEVHDQLDAVARPVQLAPITPRARELGHGRARSAHGRLGTDGEHEEWSAMIVTLGGHDDRPYVEGAQIAPLVDGFIRRSQPPSTRVHSPEPRCQMRPLILDQLAHLVVYVLDGVMALKLDTDQRQFLLRQHPPTQDPPALPRLARHSTPPPSADEGQHPRMCDQPQAESLSVSPVEKFSRIASTAPSVIPLAVALVNDEQRAQRCSTRCTAAGCSSRPGPPN